MNQPSRLCIFTVRGSIPIISILPTCARARGSGLHEAGLSTTHWGDSYSRWRGSLWLWHSRQKSECQYTADVPVTVYERTQ